MDPLDRHPKYLKLKDLDCRSPYLLQLAKNKTNDDKVAIKFLPLAEKFDKKATEEVILRHRGLAHPHVVQFKEVFVTSKYLAIVKELVEGGSLEDYIASASVTECEARWWFQQIVLVLEYWHRTLGVPHGNLSLKHVLLEKTSQFSPIKLGGIGYCKGDLSPYIAPEQLEPSLPGDPLKQDVWSCGVMLYHVLAKRNPFVKGSESPHSAVRLIRSLTQDCVLVAMDQLRHVSKDCKAFLSKLLTVDANRRPSILEVIQDPWFQQHLPDISSILLIPRNGLQTRAAIDAILQKAELSSHSLKAFSITVRKPIQIKMGSCDAPASQHPGLVSRDGSSLSINMCQDAQQTLDREHSSTLPSGSLDFSGMTRQCSGGGFSATSSMNEGVASAGGSQVTASGTACSTPRKRKPDDNDLMELEELTEVWTQFVASEHTGVRPGAGDAGSRHGSSKAIHLT